MLSKHRILTQAPTRDDVLKILPPLIIGEREMRFLCERARMMCSWIAESSRTDVELGNNFVKAALGSRRSVEARPTVSA